MKNYEFIEHTADIAIRAYGQTVDEAFAHAAEAMFDIMVENSEIRPSEQFEFECSSDDLESLLVRFLSELIVFHETKNTVLTDFEVTIRDDISVHATARGERFDNRRHESGHHIKGVSYHMMEIFRGDGGRSPYVQVLFDV